jgi:FKBP-type peptidyl-prolyl cis-trans isomerase
MSTVATAIFFLQALSLCAGFGFGHLPSIRAIRSNYRAMIFAQCNSQPRTQKELLPLVSRRNLISIGATCFPLIASNSFAESQVGNNGTPGPDGISPVEEKNDGSWAEHQGPFSNNYFQSFSRSSSGLQYLDIAAGKGDQPKLGDTVRLHYSGYLLDGSKFDSSYRAALFPFSLLVSSAPPVAFKLETGSLIPGFLEGVLGMKVGGRRVILVPPELGYGKGGAPGVIPPDSALVFFIELRKIGGGITL